MSVLTETKLTTFMAVGRALLEVRDKRLYRDTCEDFYEYCLIKWGILPDDVARYLAIVEGMSTDA